jgi:hypothetical protein
MRFLLSIGLLSLCHGQLRGGRRQGRLCDSHSACGKKEFCGRQEYGQDGCPVFVFRWGIDGDTAIAGGTNGYVKNCYRCKPCEECRMDRTGYSQMGISFGTVDGQCPAKCDAYRADVGCYSHTDCARGLDLGQSGDLYNMGYVHCRTLRFSTLASSREQHQP